MTSIFVAERTCTIIDDPPQGPKETTAHDVDRRSLDSFRSRAAIVLLGPPGSGKTVAFKRQAHTEDGVYVAARDFVTFNPKPEWKGRVLFIDGLDEMRAGRVDHRTHFDAIRKKLDRMGRPRFRISCRDVDWFGSIDRRSLEYVASSQRVLVLRLDPLSADDISEILERNLGIDDPRKFVDIAREKGVANLLANPQTLRMIAESVVSVGHWPQTKTGTFEMACRRLVSEQNCEHRVASRDGASTQGLIDDAGRLCALLLLAGKSGVTLHESGPIDNYLEIGSIPGVERSRELLATRLFDSRRDRFFVPAHRHVAEFLAARYLARVIEKKRLPVYRILSLMTGFEAEVISEFRGLAAWLAAHSEIARETLVARDPIGVLLHGDVFGFSVSEKTHLFRSLQLEIRHNPWLAGERSPDSRFEHLIDSGLEAEIRRVLLDPARDTAHRSFVHVILVALRSGQIISGLSSALQDIVRDDSWPTRHRCVALEAYARTLGHRIEDRRELRALLDDVHSGRVQTDDDELLGVLLTELYPNELGPHEILAFLKTPARSGQGTRYLTFWLDCLIEKSTAEEMVAMLDSLKAQMKNVRTEEVLVRPHFDVVGFPGHVPLALLRHLLESDYDVLQDQIVHWLEFAAWLRQGQNTPTVNRATCVSFFRRWLSGRPDIQKLVILKRASSCQESSYSFACMSELNRGLFGATPPPDYSSWCVDQALQIENQDLAGWFVGQAAMSIRDSIARDLETGAKIRKKLRSHRILLDRFESILAAPESERAFCLERSADDGRFAEIRGLARDNLAALAQNRSPPMLLHQLARAYLGDLADVRGETAADRLRFMLGSDRELLSAARAALRGAAHRADLPAWTEVLTLAIEGRTHYLAYPFMASLEILFGPEEGEADLIDDHIRLAISIHLAVSGLPRLRGPGGLPPWLSMPVSTRTHVFVRTWVQCVRRLVRSDRHFPLDAHAMIRDPAYADVATAVSLSCLVVFPVRCKSKHLYVLRDLILATCRYGDRGDLLELAEVKISHRSMNSSQKAYWLAVGLLLGSEIYGTRLASFASGSGEASRIGRVMEMAMGFRRTGIPMGSMTLEWLIRLIGPHSTLPPMDGMVYSETARMRAHHDVRDFIDGIAAIASPEAIQSVQSLIADDGLSDWRPMLLDRLDKQREAYLQAVYQHASLEQVAENLDNGRPANVGDLWAVAVDALEHSRKKIEDGPTSDWRQYWNLDHNNKPVDPRHENACRDALLSDLQEMLALRGVECVAEGLYADDARSDIRVSTSKWNVPIEIKRSCHRDWWSSVRTQLIDKYTRDPGTDGYGIYLVFWFGETDRCKPQPASGRKPRSPDEVRNAVIENLSDKERRKIAVLVIDVSKPTHRKQTVSGSIAVAGPHPVGVFRHA